MKSKLIFFLKLILLGVLGYFLFQYVEVEEIKNLLKKLKWEYLFIFIFLYPLTLSFSGLRWKIILNKFNLDLNLKELMNVTWISGFFSNFLPSTVGGDAYKLVLLKGLKSDRKVPFITSLVIDKVFGVLIFGFFVVGFSIFYIDKILDQSIVQISFFLILVATLIGSFILCFKIPFQFDEKSRWNFISHFKHFLNLIFNFSDTKTFLKALFFSGLFLLMGILSTYIGFWLFDESISFLLLCFLIPFINFTELFPFSINSIGIKEGAAIYLFQLFGYQPEVVVSVFLLNRVVLIILSATGGIGFLLNREQQINSN